MKPLAYVAELVRLDLEDFSPRTLQRVTQYCINSYKDDLAFKISPAVKVHYATMNSVGVVPMPQDMEYYTKIAIKLGGIYFTLTLNPDMPINNRLDSCGDDLEDVAVTPTDYCGEQGYVFASHFRDGNFVGEMYGMGGGFNTAGYFNMDWRNRQFQFSGVPQTEIVIEYVSNQVSEGSLIDDAAISVVRYAVHYQLALFDKKMTQADKERRKGQYLQSLHDYRVLKTALTVDEFEDIIYTYCKSSVKR